VQNLTILQEMLSGGDDGLGDGVLANYNGMKFRLNDVVDVIVGTRVGVRGNKTEPIKARFKEVVQTVRGVEFLCRPLVGSGKGRCPKFQGRVGAPNSQEIVCLRLARLVLVCWVRGRHVFFRSCSRHNKTGLQCVIFSSSALSCLLPISLSYLFYVFVRVMQRANAGLHVSYVKAVEDVRRTKMKLCEVAKKSEAKCQKAIVRVKVSYHCV
jgi:hypothetical protein